MKPMVAENRDKTAFSRNLFTNQIKQMLGEQFWFLSLKYVKPKKIY